MDFEFELSFDGNLDLYIKNKIKKEPLYNIRVLSNTILMQILNN